MKKIIATGILFQKFKVTSILGNLLGIILHVNRANEKKLEAAFLDAEKAVDRLHI